MSKNSCGESKANENSSLQMQPVVGVRPMKTDVPRLWLRFVGAKKKSHVPGCSKHAVPAQPPFSCKKKLISILI